MKPFRILRSAVGVERTARAGAALLNACVPMRAYRLRRDIAYGPDPDQRLDVYIPRVAWTGVGPRPTVMFVHGGSWETGSKGMYRFVADALAGRGWVAVMVDYRKYPRVRWPTFVEDCADAMNWVGAHAAEWGGDRRRVVAMGHSAGAHIVALLALDPRFLARGAAPVRPAGVVGLSGPYDFLPIVDPLVREVFASAEDLGQTQPISFAHAGAPPMLLLHGAADSIVWPKNSQQLAARLRSLGSVATTAIYPGVDHIALVVALSRPYRLRHSVLDDIAAFIDATAGADAPAVHAGVDAALEVGS